MQLDPAVCYRAMRARDARFDGRFFVAVRTTGIYCRPVCPAPTPRRENCTFVACAAAAEEAGYRACLRCRPEAAPGTPAWQGSSATVMRALRLIEAGALDDSGVDALAAKLGVGDRHLRRLFATHLGASPHAVAATRRSHFAKQLIDQTSMPMAEIAFAAGFASVRRFNDAIRSTFGRPPRALRRTQRGRGAGDAGVELRLAYRPPYAWEDLLAFLAARAIPGVECVTDGVYRRSFRQDDAVGWLEVAPLPASNQLRVRVRAAGAPRLIDLARRLRALFDLGAAPDAIAAALRDDAALAKALRAAPGIRVPGALDGFELAVRAILGQQVSVRGATTLAGRLVAQFGAKLPDDCLPPVSDGPVPTHEFPSPELLADADVASIGLPGARAAAIRALAREVARGGLRLEPAADPDAAREALLALPGVGEWTAAYVAMRALREPDAFPAGDLGLRRALGVAAGELARRSEAWRPWRAYAAMLLWQHGPA
jgi:AraC family transcriptional regulator of adaptative response / DNA-3-methyladenine glycosylase II